MVKNILEAFAELPDPRREHPNKLHKLLDIVVIAVCGTLAKCDGWEEIADYGIEKRNFFKQFLDLTNGIPSHDTINRVFSNLHPTAWQTCFMTWMQSISQLSAEKLVTLDGKTLRGSKSSGTGKRDEERAALELVSAWLSENELVLAQLAVPEGSNEIAVIPDLLQLLELQGATVTLDAIGCQTDIAETLIEQGGEYVLALKKNQKTLFTAVRYLFEDRLSQNAVTDTVATFEVAHGRQETRTCYVIQNFQHLAHFKLADCDLSPWTKLTSLILVQTQTKRQGKEAKNLQKNASSLVHLPFQLRML